MVSRSPIDVHLRLLHHGAEEALTGPQSVGVGHDFWGAPNLSLRHELVPKISGVIRTRAVYANLADPEQNGGILRQAVFDARAARVSALAACDNEKPPMPRPVLSIRYVWIGIDWLEAALRSLEALSVPLAVPPDVAFHEMYVLGIWRPDLSSVQVRWGVGTPGALEALSARWASLWEQMTALLRRGELIVPKEHWWPLDVPPAYEQAPVEAEAPGDEAAATDCNEKDATGA